MINHMMENVTITHYYYRLDKMGAVYCAEWVASKNSIFELTQIHFPESMPMNRYMWLEIIKLNIFFYLAILKILELTLHANIESFCLPYIFRGQLHLWITWHSDVITGAIWRLQVYRYEEYNILTVDNIKKHELTIKK